MKNLITSSDHGKLIAAGKLASRTRRNSKPDEAPSSQVKLKDENLGGLVNHSAGELVATEENQVIWEFSESESWSVHDDEVNHATSSKRTKTQTKAEIKAEVLLQNEYPSHHQILWQQYEERIKSLSQGSKVSRILYGSRICTCC